MPIRWNKMLIKIMFLIYRTFDFWGNESQHSKQLVAVK